MTLHWIIQSNLGSSDSIDHMVLACEELRLPHRLVKAIPFSSDLPDVPTEPLTVFYGATNFVLNIFRSGLWTPGVFFHEEHFKFSFWREKYGERVLNADAEVLTIEEFARRAQVAEEPMFVRPNEDSKAFAGEVVDRRKFQKWCQEISSNSTKDLTIAGEDSIVVAEPVGLDLEWRLFLVEGKVSASSQYRKNFRLDTSPEVPPEVIAFAEEQASRWSPALAFVMDVAASNGELYVIEVNGMNSSGFYKCDVKAIIGDISRAVDGMMGSSS